MLTDYKFWFIRRDDDGFITEAAVRFYEGEITTEYKQKGIGAPEQVTMYRRTKKLNPRIEIPHLVGRATKMDNSGKHVAIYTPTDFGRIKTDEELRDFLNAELEKDTTRSPVEEKKMKKIKP